MASKESAELVITAPPPFGAALAHHTGCRLTLGALTQLIAEAKKRVVISAPYLQPGYGLSGGPIAIALEAAANRGIHFDIVSTGQSLRSLALPVKNQRVQFYCPKSNLEDGLLLGCHAKFCVADRDVAYVGSANLTGPGLTQQLEMGILVRGSLAEKIADFWDYCVQIRLFIDVTNTGKSRVDVESS
jgi:phosphatidylserine/phosphatidylglycerophosphate/cardiolipin synthase-like enzyme